MFIDFENVQPGGIQFDVRLRRTDGVSASNTQRRSKETDAAESSASCCREARA